MNKKQILKAAFKSMFRTHRDDRMRLIKSRIPLYNEDQVNHGGHIVIFKTAQAIFDDIENLCRPLAGDFGETPIWKKYQKLKKKGGVK